MQHKGCGGFVAVQGEQPSAKRMGDGVDAIAELAMDVTVALGSKWAAAAAQLCAEAGGIRWWYGIPPIQISRLILVVVPAIVRTALELQRVAGGAGSKIGVAINEGVVSAAVWGAFTVNTGDGAEHGMMATQACRLGIGEFR